MSDPRRSLVLGLLADGLSIREAAGVSGVYPQLISAFARQAGWVLRQGRRGGLVPDSLQQAVNDPTLLVRTDHQDYLDPRGRLTQAARGAVQAMICQGRSDAEIAVSLGVNRSTVWRERRRCGSDRAGYRARVAHAQVEAGTARPRAPKLQQPLLRAEVIQRLDKRWSPEQVAADLRRCYPHRQDMWVSHETIYQALYVQGKGALRHELAVAKATRTGRTARQPRSKLPPRASNRSWIEADNLITARPAEVADRAVPGHWEGDLVLGAKNGTAVITLAERSTRYLLMRRLPDTHDAQTVAQALIELVADLPGHLRRTLTWDQGVEMATYPVFTLATDCRVYFCDPHSPWQRGTNENTNGLVRDFFPKGTDFTHVTDAELQHAQDLLNTRPRKTLGFDTPTARLTELLTVAQTT